MRQYIDKFLVLYGTSNGYITDVYGLYQWNVYQHSEWMHNTRYIIHTYLMEFDGCKKQWPWVWSSWHFDIVKWYYVITYPCHNGYWSFTMMLCCLAMAHQVPLSQFPATEDLTIISLVHCWVSLCWPKQTKLGFICLALINYSLGQDRSSILS